MGGKTNHYPSREEMMPWRYRTLDDPPGASLMTIHSTSLPGSYTLAMWGEGLTAR